MKEAGIVRLSDGKLTAAVAIGSPDPKETAEPIATAEKLAPVVKETGGGEYWLESFDGVPRLVKVAAGRQMAGSGWMGLKGNDAFRVKAVSEIPLFSTLIMLGLLLAGLGAMWYREGR
jgi:hypothetical protein